MADPTITARINGDSSGLRRELGQADQGVMRFASNLRGIASAIGVAFSVGTITQFARQMLQDADNTATYAKGIGEATTAVVALQQSAATFGQSGDKVLTWIQKVADAQDKLGSGQGEGLEKWLKAIGVSSKDFVDASPARAMEMLMKAADGAAGGVGALNAVLGRGAASDATEAFQDLVKNGLDPLIVKYAQLGQSIERLAELNGRLEKRQASFTAYMVEGWGLMAEEWDRVAAQTERKMGNAPGWLKGINTAGAFLFNNAVYAGTLGQVDLAAKLPQAPPIAGAKPGGRGTGDQGAAEATAREVARVLEKVGERQYAEAFQARLGRMSDPELKHLDAQTDQWLKDAIEAAVDPDLIEQLVKNQDMIRKALKERADRDKEFLDAIDDYNRKLAAINKKETEGIAAERTRKTEAIDAVRGDLPRLSSIESVGAVLGATGGYALGMADRLRKIEDINAQSLRKQEEIRIEANAARKLLEGEQ